MDALLQFAGNYWWLIFPLGGVIGGGLKTISAANERRAERRLERYRIKHQSKMAVAEAAARGRDDVAASRRSVGRTLEEHDVVNARWLEYELDVAKLLDYPLMTDLRDPLTLAFHRARSRADSLRPTDPEELAGDPTRRDEYRNAVHDFASAFDVAEAEAVRRRRTEFSVEAQGRIDRAQRLLRLASDDGATAPERQQAYAKAQRELEGLVMLPSRAKAQIEQRIAAAIEA